MNQSFVTVDIRDILVGEPLPVALYIYIDFRFITFRGAGDVIDRAAFDRLQFRKVKNLFIVDEDRDAFKAWLKSREAEGVLPEAVRKSSFGKIRDHVHRKMLDIFLSKHPDKIVREALNSSKKLVNEVMRFPFTSKSLSQLQTFSQGTVDHSVNVSVLATYLAMQMGYSHRLILQHVGMGALLHDIGKSLIEITDDDSPAEAALKMRAHPTVGLKMLEAQPSVPKEVKLIVEQHHEAHDGSGYPKGLRGNAIYDLARIVGISNRFDGLVADGKGTLVERQRKAIYQLDQIHYRQFDPVKLDKALKILRLGV